MKTILGTLPASPSSSSSLPPPLPPYCGTEEGSKIWYNTNDPSAMVLSGAVWVMIIFSMVVCAQVILLQPYGPQINKYLSYAVLFACFMGWFSHAVCMLSDPGVIPSDAKPLSSRSSSFASYNKDEIGNEYLGTGSSDDKTSHDNIIKDELYGMRNNGSSNNLTATMIGDEENLVEPLQHVMCGMCDGYKPPFAHHDRMSGRCISRMDHFCPWTNNAIGAKNQKSFILFVTYTNIASWIFCLILYINWMSCSSVSCSKDPRHKTILQVQVIVLIFSVIFTTSMLVTQIYSLMTGIGTIDRMQMRRNQADSYQPIPFNHVFGDETPYRWFLPTEPHFDDPEAVLLYRRTSGW